MKSNFRHQCLQRVLLAFFIFFQVLAPVWGKPAKGFSFAELTEDALALREIAAMAERNGVTMGIYGGTVRDLYLGHKFTIISDLGLIFDTREPG
ncbi:hypothetical protein HYY75_03080, partial [bacterium]|nr:hypothetical protein [bacterium]